MDKNEALRTFTTGENFHLQHYLGAHQDEVDGKSGYSFRVWAPNAQSVHLIGDFTNWYEEQIPMVRNEAGVWEVFTELPKEGDIYKYNIKRSSGQEILKIDPLAIYLEERPGTGAVIRTIPEKKWKDGLWLARRKRWGFFSRPVNIYEVHAGSWKRNEDGSPYSFAQLKEDLIPYLVEMNYTHVEFMPLMAHPLGLSWGYQLMGYFAFEHTYGTPEEFQDFVEECHLNNIGVIVDWVPGHFTINDDALAYYDGTPTFEYQDHDRAHNYGWGALNFDLGKNQVQSFLISSIKFWIDFYHLDGIRVDAVSNMLYLDYDSGPWQPNKDGGNRNYEGYYFLQRLNTVIKLAHPDVMMIAEESSSETKITGMRELGGLGFDYKWNMGWMNDFLEFMKLDPYFRSGDYNGLTFSLLYAYSENFILVLSHDEVVHGKATLAGKMPGATQEEKFNNLRVAYGFMMTHPGKKLLFMGQEFGQMNEWNEDVSLEWDLLEYENHKKMQRYSKALNKLYLDYPALYKLDYNPDGFEWINCTSKDETIVVFLRKTEKEEDTLVVVCNFTPVVYEREIGVPYKGTYTEIFNSDDKKFGGSGVGNKRAKKSVKKKVDGRENSLKIKVPPMAMVVFKWDK